MKYYKYPDEEFFGEAATTYIEVQNGYAVRQLRFNGKEYGASNVDDPRWTMGLAEGYVDCSEWVEEGEVTPITKQEFDEVWNAHLALRQPLWDGAKQTYPIGTSVQGSIKLFYPQGVIVKLGGNILGVADYDKCRASTTRENMYPRHKVTAVVSGYDEVNQWIILDSPQIYSQEV